MITDPIKREPHPGLWVCSTSGGFCGYPRKVTRVTGARVWFELGPDHPSRRGGKTESYMGHDAVRYVCDTEDEGKAMFELGIERGNAIAKAEREARLRVIAEYAPRVEEMLGGKKD